MRPTWDLNGLHIIIHRWWQWMITAVYSKSWPRCNHINMHAQLGISASRDTAGEGYRDVLRRWYIEQREAHSPDCYLTNFRETSPEHDTLQFCMDWTVGDSSVAVCIEVECWCVSSTMTCYRKYLRRVRALLILKKYYKIKGEQEEGVD